MKAKSPSFRWLILAGCCVLQGVGLGIVNNCSSLFYVPVAENLGFSIGNISLTGTITGGVCALAMLLTNWLLRRIDIRLLLSLSVVISGLSILATAFSTQLWQWYAASVGIGLSNAFLTSLLPPIVLRNWFDRKSGSAIGISTAFASLTGILFSMLLGLLLDRYPWQPVRIFTALIIMAMALPFTLFIIRYRPRDVGLQPYGWDGGDQAAALRHAGDEQSTPLSALLRQRTFWLCMAFFSIIRVCNAYQHHVTIYGVSIAYDLTSPALLTTMFMVGGIISKILIGFLCDRFSEKACALASLAVIAAGFALSATGWDWAVLLGSGLFGVVSSVSVVLIAIIIGRFYQGGTYNQVFSYVSVLTVILYSLSVSVYGFGYDILGSYVPLQLACIALLTLGAVVLLALYRSKKSVPSL